MIETATKTAPANLLLESNSEHWGTPSPYVELARYALERLNCDPASDAYWNYHVVKADTFFDERIDGLKARWFGNVLHNAPGNVKKNMRVRPWWERLIDFYAHGEVDAAVWIGFQLGQLQTLQGAASHPLAFVNLFPRERIDFLLRMSGNAPPQPAGSPMHANYVTILPSRSSPTKARAQLARFIERAQSLEIGGAIVRSL